LDKRTDVLWIAERTVTGFDSVRSLCKNQYMYGSFLRRFAVFISMAAVCLCGGCGGGKTDDIPGSPVNVQEYAQAAGGYSDGGSGRVSLANDAAAAAAFALDYRPLKAEPANEAETLSAAELAGASSAAQGGSGRGSVVGGGLRRLQDYKTVYLDPARESARVQAIRAAQEVEGRLESAGSEPLTVVDWGPKGEYSSAIQRPSVYVIFSQPMIPIASLGEPGAYSPVVTISPPLAGSFRWYGTSFLSFEAEEPCQSQQVYTITVADNARSLSGAEISGETVFSFYTETLRIKSITPGEEFRKSSSIRFDNNNVPPEAAKQIGLEFNYPVRVPDIGRYLEITAAGAQTGFTLRQEDEYRITASLLDPVGFDAQVRVVLKAGARSRGGSRGTESDQALSFFTPGPFAALSYNIRTGYGRYGGVVDVNFSHALNESSALAAVRTEPAMPIDTGNIEARGSTLRLFNLPVGFGSRFRLFVTEDAQDVYGRRLGASYYWDIVMPNEPPPEGDVNYLDYRSNVMLEAQFPPRYLFEYQNIVRGSRYMLTAVDNPWNVRERYWDNVPPIELSAGTANTKYIEEIDLSPYLNEQGRGFAAFHADLSLLTNERISGDKYRMGTRNVKNYFSIQVTDLGVTVRYGFNRAVVLVTSLSTGRPVEGARVRMLPSSVVDSGAGLSAVESFAESATGANGLAVIDMDAMTLRANTANDNKWRGFDEPVVMVEKDGDRAVFSPASHNIWRFGVESAVPQRAQEITPRVFMFSDRGLYKPGETLTFRGVDRSRVLGMYAVYHGDYTVVLEENTYRPQQAVSISGITTDSGSFYGKFSIPEDLQPGSYRLVYKRGIVTAGDDVEGETVESEAVASIPITVAFFERLKFQAVLSSPPAPVIMGDDINLNLTASYLSGGSLSGAAWEGSWYDEMTVFQPEAAETKGYSFGPRRAWDSRRYIASQDGVLSGQGSAALSQRTGGSKVDGAPYVYRAEARVTDLSNQMISANRSVYVHPAGFYIGLRSSAGGFARAGQECAFGYLTVNTDGERTSGNGLFLQSGEGAGQIKAELIREEWRRVQQRGVSGYINDEYVPQQIIDGSQMISIQNGGGTIRVKPSAAGFYILRVSSKDREGRTALTEFSFYVTGSGGYWNMNNPTELRLTPDQDVYEPGDTAQVLLQSALPEGYYLITVERDGIFTEEVRHISESVSVIDVPIARNYVPVVYVAVSSYSVRSGPPTHEYGEPDLDKPKGYFGVTKINVNPRTRAFSVGVQTDRKTYRPGEEVTMTLTATKDGRPLANAELALMAVDRGVLDLINYHVPDPVGYFYSEQNFPLFVNGGDSRSMLMDPVTYTVRNRMGGDADGDSKIEERSDFNPTAVFEPMLITGADGRVTCRFKLPDNLTTYRVTVFGVRGDLFALKESELAAQNVINVREVVPRRLRERDTAEAGVLITNLDSSPHTLTVRLDVGPPLPNDEASGLSKAAGQAFVDGTAERRVTVRSGGNAVVYFDAAAVKEGTVTLNFTVTSDILNERLVREMIIEHPYVMETVTTAGTVDGSSAREGLVIPSFADNGTGSLTLTLDAARLSLLDSGISYLFSYPYGCLEQRSSAVMPLVVFGEYLDALSIKTEVSDPRRVVENELRSWANYQLSGGGFPYWPSGTRADFYVSLRIAHVIAIAKSKGINAPSSLNIQALVSYLNREYQDVQSWRGGSSEYAYKSYLQTYMLYVSALLGERVDPSRLAEILRRDNVDPSVLAMAGMTYRAVGRNADAANTAARLRNLVRMTARGADITDPLDKQRYSYYGGKAEQLALALQFFADQYRGDDINTRLLYSLLESRRSGTAYWENTAATARVLCAVDALIRAEDLANLDAVGAVSLAGTELLQGSFKGIGAQPVTGTVDFNSQAMASLARDVLQTLDFTRSGRGNVYYTASLRYAIPSELQSFRDEGLGVFLSIYDISTGEEINTAALQSGKTYRARVRVSSTRDRAYLALRVPVPSGAEILDAAFVTTSSYEDSGGSDGNEQARGGSYLSHQAIMDNEIQYFWNHFNRGESTVSFLFRTARRGVYPTPPAQAECMYEPEVFGRSRGLIYTIE